MMMLKPALLLRAAACCWMTLAASAGADAAAALEAVYENFARAGVFDPELPNDEANELVAQGLYSGAPRLVRLTVRAMGAHATMGQGGYGEPVVERNFAAVPQIKEFLISLWHASDPENYEDGDALDVGADNPWVAAAEITPTWALVPRVLAAYFPGDDDVHDLLWEFCSGFQGDPKMAGWILMVFNEGHFKTPEVDRLRIDGLNSDNRFTFMHAARGLAISRTSRGLEALVDVLRRDKESTVLSSPLERRDREKLLVDAILAHGTDAIPLLDEAGLEHVSSKIVRID